MKFTVAGRGVQEIREEMLRLLIEIARGDEVDPKTAAAQVAAARTVLDSLPTETAAEELERILKDPAAAIAWCEDAIPYYRARLRARGEELDA